MRALCVAYFFASVFLVTGRSSPAWSFIALHSERYPTVPNGLPEEARQSYELLIENGVWDRGQLGIDFPLATPLNTKEAKYVQMLDDERGRVVVNSRAWRALSLLHRRAVLDALLGKLHPLTAHHIRPAPEQSSFADEPLVAYLQAGDPAWEAWYNLLSPFATYWQERAVKSPLEPNCFHAAIAAVTTTRLPHRFMSPEQFSCFLAHDFAEVPSPAQAGDTIVLYDEQNAGDDEPALLHAATFVGFALPQHEPIYLSKNGRNAGTYLYMDEATLKSLYPSGAARYFRRHLSQGSAFGQSCL